MTTLTIDVAQFVGVFVECIFYGLYLATVLIYLREVMFYKSRLTWKPQFKNHWTLLAVMMLMLTFSSLNLFLGLVRILQAFAGPSRSGSEPGSIQQLGQDWVNILKALSVNVQTIIADGVLVYRCWIIYRKSWKIIALPFLLWLEVIACTIVGVYMQVTLRSGPRSSAAMPVAFALWASTIFLHIYVTSIIVFRVWRVEKQSAGVEGLPPLYPFSSRCRSRLQLITRTIIESALLYTIMSIIVFIGFITKSNAIYITSAMYIQIIGITFNFILIRASNNRENTSTTTTTTTFIHGISTLDGVDFPGNSSTLEIRTANNSDSVIMVQGDLEKGTRSTSS